MGNKCFRSIILALVFAFCSPRLAHSQSWLEKLGEKVLNVAKGTVERKVEKKTEATISDAMDGKIGKKEKETNTKTSTKTNKTETAGKDVAPTISTASDFRRGATILFQDDLTGEQVGDFPSKWDLLGGEAEVKNLGNWKVINLGGRITPQMNTTGAYLPEEFTLEFEWYHFNQHFESGSTGFALILGRPDDVVRKSADKATANAPLYLGVECGAEASLWTEMRTTTDDRADGREFLYAETNGWHLAQISFNKRAVKVYVDGKLLVNHPNMMRPAYLSFVTDIDDGSCVCLRNIVLAQ